MREPSESRVTVNGLQLALFEWPGDGQPVFFAHATGFHARCWDQLIARLPGVHCFALDMRGHGRSDKPPPPYEWRNFGSDVGQVARAIGLRDAIGVGHSKGGFAVTLAAALEPSAFSKLLLVDPVILAEEAYVEEQRELRDHFAARRRNHWQSPDEMFASFKDRPPFNSWDPAVLRDYCDHGLLPAPDGNGMVLACPPEIEAATYAGSAGNSIYGSIQDITIPVRILRARTRVGAVAVDMSGSPTAPDLASRFPNGEDFYLPEHTHFIPMEAPDLVARHILELLEHE